MNFDKCTSGGEDIPRHSDDEGREMYWNMTAEPLGDIICTDNAGKIYRYPANKTMVYGSCD